MLDHKELRAGEVFLGNTSMKTWPRVELAGLKTFRLGIQAIDLDGKQIDRAQMRPLFLAEKEEPHYDAVMVNRLKSIRGW
jgi:hypothetical protein